MVVKTEVSGQKSEISKQRAARNRKQKNKDAHGKAE